jgi:YD repeat-containing protein
VLGADGTVETITGTTIHPVWSVDRREWVQLAELAQGERLCCDTESFGLGFPSSLPPKASSLVLSVTLSRVTQPVYNIEVHGEHVYQVGELGLVVHNACPTNIGVASSKAARQVPPGVKILTGHYVDDLGRVQPWRAHYDEFGRLVARTDYNAGNLAQKIPDTHYHIYSYDNWHEWGREILSHLPGEFMP